MMIFNKNILSNYLRGKVVLAITFILLSCESFVDVELTTSLVTSNLVFSTDITATSAMTGVYVDMLEAQSFASGSPQSVTVLAGLSSDELKTYSTSQDFGQFNQNAILSTNLLVLTLWQTMYKSIYESNAVIEGLSKSTSISESVSRQLDGEARFMRAFCHFYLVNLFGEVPLVLSTDYGKNAVVRRASIDEIYIQIVADLKQSMVNLSDDYVDTERARPNRATAAALLSRVYLYQGNWRDADILASSIIGDSRYGLTSDLGAVFKNISQETIWQLRPINPSVNTWDGYYFILNTSPVRSISGNTVSTNLLDSFENGDKRLSSWVGSYIDEDLNEWYFPFKYKVQSGRDPFDEYSIVFRLAEQYLIRAEARLRLGDTPGAIADIDSVRNRAGLPLLSLTNPNIGSDELFSKIQHERQIELFSEWGHRWFDLKRTGQADNVLKAVKMEWSIQDVLYPLPDSERQKNPNLGLQNPGYL